MEQHCHHQPGQHAPRNQDDHVTHCENHDDRVTQAARDARGRVVAAEGEHRASRALRHAAEVIIIFYLSKEGGVWGGGGGET